MGLAGVGRVLPDAGTAVLWYEYPPRLVLVGVEGVDGLGGSMLVWRSSGWGSVGFGGVIELVLYGLRGFAVPSLDASVKLCTG